MTEDMRLRNFSAYTESSYVHDVAEIARDLNMSPEHLGGRYPWLPVLPESVEEYLYPAELFQTFEGDSD